MRFCLHGFALVALAAAVLAMLGAVIRALNTSALLAERIRAIVLIVPIEGIERRRQLTIFSLNK
jgi:hypothetical protein